MQGFHHVAPTVTDLDHGGGGAWYRDTLRCKEVFCETGARRAWVTRLPPAVTASAEQDQTTAASVLAPPVWTSYPSVHAADRDELERFSISANAGVVHSGAIDVPSGAILI